MRLMNKGNGGVNQHRNHQERTNTTRVFKTPNNKNTNDPKTLEDDNAGEIFLR